MDRQTYNDNIADCRIRQGFRRNVYCQSVEMHYITHALKTGRSCILEPFETISIKSIKRRRIVNVKF